LGAESLVCDKEEAFGVLGQMEKSGRLENCWAQDFTNCQVLNLFASCIVTFSRGHVFHRALVTFASSFLQVRQIQQFLAVESEQ
jgi:hypothetical protein